MERACGFGAERTRGRYRGTRGDSLADQLRSRLRHHRGLLARGALFAILKWHETHLVVTALERPGEELVREPRVLRKARTVAVRADDLPLHRAFGAVFTVVPVPDHDRAKRDGLRAQVRATAVVLESHKETFRRLRDEIADEAL